MTTSTVTPEIATFAQGVRAALADLPADEVDDLTEGLEADLAEAYAEDLQRELPDPAAYAAELRLAAGLPVRSKVKSGLLSGLGDGLRDTKRDIGIAIRRNPALAGIADFLVSLRPVWWVLRAWLATWLVAAFFGGERGYWFGGTGWFLVLAAFVAISVQWGRGKWRSDRALPLIALGNVFAVVALLPVMAAADDWQSSYVDEVYSPAPSGTSIDGEQVSNIFAFDAKGNPLTGVQLFDQSGRPLNMGSDTTGPECDVTCEVDIVRLPRILDNGRTAWNVFPLSEAREEQTTYDEMTNSYVLNSGEKASAPTSPFVKVPALMPAPKGAKPTP
ncbi:hypothetical protein J2X11_000956 [Aeromicrobium panaciterrae]|uniref:Uncharacterized protein n=1 Tax=Aeromicrobium panaciterrae TaxID=363861 RepID=A0ABU1ULQ5_9ACTN|nr:hypothetical protein [Aeromicrobium panaciterrae]MDR7086117.1 hypothetical protein [Aeromicrobium panaciterrae]